MCRYIYTLSMHTHSVLFGFSLCIFYKKDSKETPQFGVKIAVDITVYFYKH